jgi:CRISPR system Cascade subunit CasA
MIMTIVRNLIRDHWIPVRCKNGDRLKIAPWQLTQDHEENPIIALDAPRQDFGGALAQFLIGLLQVAATPGDRSGIDWLAWLEHAPEPDHLNTLMSKYAEYFVLGGNGPRFMQDFESLDEAPKPVSALLIDAPGAQTERLNADHFIKRGGVDGICSDCAAAALFTLQANAPSGGAGHRTSLRGGGPLTTLVVLDPRGSEQPATLWRDLWLNVLDEDHVAGLSGNVRLSEPEAIFPWLAPTRISGKGGKDTFPQDVHPLQMYWGMPRRIRLELDGLSEGNCDICGAQDTPLIRHYVTKNYGINYTGAWEHPLSPHYRDSKSGMPMPAHAQPGGFSYRHWISWTGNSQDHLRARVVERFERVLCQGEQLRLWAFGFDMDNMKARAWYETTVPLYLLSPGEQRDHFIATVDRLIEAGVQVAGYLHGAVKDAWFKRPGDVRGDLSYLKQAFYERTAGDFFVHLRAFHQAALNGMNDQKSGLEAWLKFLREEAEHLFEEYADGGVTANEDLARWSRAQTGLRKRLWGPKLYDILQLVKPKKKYKE